MGDKHSALSIAADLQSIVPERHIDAMDRIFTCNHGELHDLLYKVESAYNKEIKEPVIKLGQSEKRNRLAKAIEAIKARMGIYKVTL